MVHRLGLKSQDLLKQSETSSAEIGMALHWRWLHHCWGIQASPTLACARPQHMLRKKLLGACALASRMAMFNINFCNVHPHKHYHSGCTIKLRNHRPWGDLGGIILASRLDALDALDALSPKWTDVSWQWNLQWNSWPKASQKHSETSENTA